MATRFIILTQIHHRPKPGLISTLKSRRNKPKPISENTLSNVFPGKTSTEIYHDNVNLHPLTNPLLFGEDQSVKEVEASRQEHGKVSINCDGIEGKSINAKNHRDLRREAARLCLSWYMKCSISYILRKARAFYNEFSCGTYAESRSTMVVVDPYFSIPVII